MSERDAPGPSASLSGWDRLLLALEREGNRRLRRLGNRLYRLTRGRIMLTGRDVMLLTTRGRKTGRAHTVLLQFFPDEQGMLVVAANAGQASPPDWYRNLTTAGTADIEIRGHHHRVCPVTLTAEEAAATWPRIAARAPTYERYREAAGRPLPIVRLVPDVE